MTESRGVQPPKGTVVSLPRHPDRCSSPAELESYTGRIRGPLLATDLFCGAGGLSLGLEEAGIRSVIGVDFDDYALETYGSLFGGMALKRDLSDDAAIEEVSELSLRAGVDVIVGGPPCQPFSRAGRATIRNLVAQGIRQPYDHRRDMWQSFLEVVAKVKPRAVIIENVPDMALGDESLILRLITADLENQGYSVTARLVDAWRYGVPQHRQRLIIVAMAGEVEFEWPGEAETHPSVNDAISDLPPIVGGWTEADPDGWFPYDGPITELQRWARQHVTGANSNRIYDHITRSVREDDLRIFASMDSDTRYSDIDEDLKRYRDDIFDDKYNRLSGDDLSRTIIAHLAKDGYGFIHPTQNRTISIREAARLQTFPDHVRFAGPPTAGFRQIGNAVPPLLGRKLGEALQQSLAYDRVSYRSAARVSNELAAWYRTHGMAGLPWLEAGSEWAIRLGEALLKPSDPPYLIGPIRSAIRDIGSPVDVLARVDDLRDLAGQPSRKDDLEKVIQAAVDVVEGRSVKVDSAWRLAQLASPSSDQPVMFTAKGILRVVARYFGSSVDRDNQGSDGRIQASLMIGVEPEAREANLALLGLAQGICAPASPRCGECPLQTGCAYASTAPVQVPLALES